MKCHNLFCFKKTALNETVVNFCENDNIYFWSIKTFSSIETKFLPALRSHIVFDLSGQLELEPFIISQGEDFFDLNLPKDALICGISFFNPDFRNLRKLNRDNSILLNAEWVYYIYFEMLERLNQEGFKFEKFGEIIFDDYKKFFDNGGDNSVHNGGVSGYQKADEYSDRQKQRIFKLDFDTTQSKVKSIIKFQQNLQNMLLQNRVVYSHKFYFDQSHFIKRFKKYTGLTPEEFIKNWTCPFCTIQN